MTEMSIAALPLPRCHGDGGSSFFGDIIKMREFAQNLRFYKCNTQKRSESDGFKLTELI
jgi:hypothetical protein